MAKGACVMKGGHVWQRGYMHEIHRDTINEWALCILLECILVVQYFYKVSLI